MTPAEFVFWLRGYLKGASDIPVEHQQAIEDALCEVTAQPGKLAPAGPMPRGADRPKTKDEDGAFIDSLTERLEEKTWVGGAPHITGGFPMRPGDVYPVGPLIGNPGPIWAADAKTYSFVGASMKAESALQNATSCTTSATAAAEITAEAVTNASNSK